VDGLLYGDDPAQGFVIGRRFAHPVMRIGFEAPEGFTLTNSPQRILIEAPRA
jgi:predicted Zn-dependent protease